VVIGYIIVPIFNISTAPNLFLEVIVILVVVDLAALFMRMDVSYMILEARYVELASATEDRVAVSRFGRILGHIIAGSSRASVVTPPRRRLWRLVVGETIVVTACRF